METSGWSFRQQHIGEDAVTSIAILGQDVILIEDIGTPYQTLKPVTGDFGVVAKLMHDGERWLEKHRQSEAGLNTGHSIWIEWKHACLKAVMNIEEFFEAHSGDEVSPSPGI